MSHSVGKALLEAVRAGTADWVPAARLSPATTYWQGVVDWPRPDQAFQDTSTGSSVAIEFKPPGHAKGEYVRGVGQIVTYLDTFEAAAIVVPRLASDGFPISDYLSDLLQKPFANALPVGLLDYTTDPALVRTRIPVRPRAGSVPPIPTGKRKVFWAYWRDLSQYDLFDILQRMDAGHTYDRAFEYFWRTRRAKGKARTWEGNNRKANAAGTPFAKSEHINTELSLRHAGLIDSTGRLTEDGIDMVRVGKVYGPESVAFRYRMGYQVLVIGRHLELLFWVNEAQAQLSRRDRGTSKKFYRALDDRLIAEGIITPARGRAKPTFLRDEPKLWNKLGLLVRTPGGQYVFRGEGFRFEWRTIVDMANYK
jgi:hypothetical protein